MKSDCKIVSMTDSGLVSQLVLDYLNDEPFLRNFHRGKPDTNLLNLVAKQREQYPVNRKLVAEVIRKQYQECGITDEVTLAQTDRLELKNTYTVTTGQQIGTFLGPAFTLMKILTTIKLSEQLSELFPENQYVPVFWMATEDHDVEEIRHHWFRGRNYTWETSQEGPVGRFNTIGISDLIQQMRPDGGKEHSMQELFDLFEEVYQAENLSKATRKLAHALFGHLGLVILDADDSRLKSSFSEIIRRDILERNSHHLVEVSKGELSQRYPIQVKGREINFFWIEQGVRSRIALSDGLFQTTDGRKSWNETQLISAIETHPEYFSPNVIMRPLYQEFILPNIAYIGGGAEIAYWLELKKTFEYYGISFPVLLLRNSLTMVDGVNIRNLEKYQLGCKDVFLSSDMLIAKVLKMKFGEEFRLDKERESVSLILQELKSKAVKIAPSKAASAEAMEKRWLHELDRYSSKLFRYRKQLETELIHSLERIHQDVFPEEILQERIIGIPELTFRSGDIIQRLYKRTEPLQPQMIFA